MSSPNSASRPASSRSARGIVLIFALVVAGVAGAVSLWRHFVHREMTANVPAPAPPAEFVPAAQTTPLDLRLVDVTEESGIRFTHTSGAAGKKLLPETMGGACAVLDFDRDGDQDILFVNSSSWPGASSGGKPPTQCLYANDGKGHFTDVTNATGLDVTFYGMGAAVGDYDGDGWDDVFFTGVGGERLYRNVEGKRFEDSTAAARLPSEGPNTWSTGAAFLDYDNDGRLDLFFTRYVEWSPEADLAQAFQITGLERAYGPPQNFAGTFCRLLRNAGGGRFEDVSAKAGVQVRSPLTGQPMGKGLGVGTFDMDDDGWCDVAVANDTVQNFLFRNRKDGTFEEIGILSGFAFDEAGRTRGAMGIDWSETGDGGAKAIVVGNFSNEITALYRSDRPGLIPFSDDATAEGIGNPSRKYMKFGVFFFDLDLDGRLDIFEANGHLEVEIEKVQAEQTYRQPVQIFWNAGPSAPRRYEAMGPEKVGPDVFRPVVGRGCAYADFDGDGDLDVVLVPNGGAARLFRNDGGNRNHWVRLKLVGKPGNTNAFGARVSARVGGEERRFQLSSGRSYLSQCEQVITMGLGSGTKAEAVKVFWPGQSAAQDVGEVPAGTLLEVKQP
ncbi:MAG TPA: CRTAC1 family protein [Planctomycetota bacterium]|nr:CRTAC1 family protein [Planctomycetota bacterium]